MQRSVLKISNILLTVPNVEFNQRYLIQTQLNVESRRIIHSKKVNDCFRFWSVPIFPPITNRRSSLSGIEGMSLSVTNVALIGYNTVVFSARCFRVYTLISVAASGCQTQGQNTDRARHGRYLNLCVMRVPYNHCLSGLSKLTDSSHRSLRYSLPLHISRFRSCVHFLL